MNVSLKNNDAVSGIVKLEIVKADYADQVDKSLRSLRQKANVPGFRKGMVPMGMVKKMYGKHVLVEEINKLVSENLFKYIRENDLHILGEPMPNENNQVNAYRSNFGSYDKVDEVEEKDMVKGTVAELENGAPKEGGIVVEDAVLMPMYIKDE